MNTPMRKVIGSLAVTGILLAGLLAGRGELWLSSAASGSQTGSQAGTGVAPQAQAAAAPRQAVPANVPKEPESLQDAFIRIAKDVGPAVVSISTEQIERVRQYMRGIPRSPFMGEDPFEDLFRQFYGDGQEQQFRRFGLGSGLIVDPEGYVLTNEHVVADAEKITVTLTDGREFTGTVKGRDPRTDLAVVKIDAKALPVVTLGDSTNLQAGQWVVALGNPLGLAGIGPTAQTFGSDPTVSVGVVSALHRQLPRTSRYDRDYSDLIQTDATINPGNSGGPLVNLEGEIIGVNVAIITGPGNAYGFAIPVNKAKGILDTLIQGKQVIYGWLGIQIQDITEDVAEYYGLPERKGVLVYQVLPDSPAANAGVRDGDIITAFDGQPILHSRELIDRVSATKAGREVKLEVLREGKRQTIDVKIGERPTDTDIASGGGSAESWRGVKVGALAPEQLERMGIDAAGSGVVVMQVEPGSPAEQAGLREGDVINEIKGTINGSLTSVKIESVGDFTKATSALKGNALVRTNRGYVVIKAGP
jgi:serine protease Do